MDRLSERAGSARLSLVHGSRPPPPPRHHQTTRRRLSGSTDGRCTADSDHGVAPLSKASSVGCCRSLVADDSPLTVSCRILRLYLSTQVSLPCMFRYVRKYCGHATILGTVFLSVGQSCVSFYRCACLSKTFERNYLLSKYLA